jgi:hypothetical protein
MTEANPSKLTPPARGDNALAVARGGFDAWSSHDTRVEMEKVIALLAQGRISFGTPGKTWEFFRAAVDAIVRKTRDEEKFRGGLRELALKSYAIPQTLATIFGLPSAAFAGIPPIDVGRIAGVVVYAYAPELASIVPAASKPKSGQLEVEVTFPEETLRQIIREELADIRVPTVEYNPTAGFNLMRVPGVEAPAPEPEPEEPPLTAAEAVEKVATEPAAPATPAPSWPAIEHLRTFSKAELTATLQSWKQTFDKSGVRPPRVLYDAARARFTQLFRMPAPEIFPAESPPKAPAPAYESRVSVPPATVAGAAEVVASAALYGGERAPALLTEKYRPRRLAQVLGNPKIINRLKLMARSPEPVPASMVFTGLPGLGKTSVAQAFVRDYLHYQLARRNAEDVLGPDDTPLPKTLYFEVNAAALKDDPSGFILGRVLPFIKAQGLYGGSVKKFLVFDDVSNIPPETQKVLLRPLEQWGRNTTVIWISNDPMRHLPALESRSAGAIFSFSPLSSDDMAKGLARVAEGEGWNFPDPKRIYERIANSAQGDLRAGIGFLAAAWDEVVTEAGG